MEKISVKKNSNSGYDRIGLFLRGDGTTYRTIYIAILGIWVVGFFIGVFAPTNVLTESWVLRQYVSATSFIASAQEMATSKSLYPEVTALYHSVVYWSLPLWFLVWWKWVNSQIGVSKTGVIFKARLSFLDRLLVLLLLPLWMFLGYAFTLNHGGDTRLIAFGSSRLQLAIFGMGIPAGMGAMLAFSLFSIKRLITFGK